MRRREFITLLGGTALAFPLAASAQQRLMPMIGWLNGGSRDGDAEFVTVFQQSLRQAGYVEGQNVAIEYRWADNRFDRLPALAADLVRRQVAVIFVDAGTIGALAAKAATSTIPIVFVQGGDPIKAGLVTSLNRPGGNITGFNLIAGALDAKRLELLNEVVRKTALVAVLLNPNNPNADPEFKQIQAAAQVLKLQVRAFDASTERDIDAAFAKLIEQRAGALLVGTDRFLNGRVDQLVKLAARHAIPTIYGFREFSVAGGLMSYGTSARDARRQAAFYVARILKGEKPSDLPVQQSTKVELVLNLKTANTLGLSFPIPLLGRADEVIE